MICLPPNTIKAVWLSRTVSPKGKTQHPWSKYYILAYNHYFLFRVYNRPDGIFMGNIVETFLPIEKSFEAKLQEKLGKGYNKLNIDWDSRNEEWQSTLPVLQVAGRPSRMHETRLSATALEHSAYDKITLDLFETREGNFRLEHFETSQQGSHAGFPLWQTLFSDKQQARAVLAEVVAKKQELGYRLIAAHPPLHPLSPLAGLYPLSPKVAEAFRDVQTDAWF